MSNLRQFIAAIAATLALALGGHHYWSGQHGANFNPDVQLDTSQVIDATEKHDLFRI